MLLFNFGVPMPIAWARPMTQCTFATWCNLLAIFRKEEWCGPCQLAPLTWDCTVQCGPMHILERDGCYWHQVVGPTLDILLGIWCLIRRWVLFVLKNPTNNIWAQIFFSLLLFSWLYSFGVVLQYLESSIENSSFVFIRMYVSKIDIHIGWFWLTDRQLKLQTGLLNVCLLSLLNSFEGVNNKIIVESITLAERSPKKWTPGPHKNNLVVGTSTPMGSSPAQ